MFSIFRGTKEIASQFFPNKFKCFDCDYGENSPTHQIKEILNMTPLRQHISKDIAHILETRMKKL